MQFYPEEHFLTGDDLLFEYDPEVWHHLLSWLLPVWLHILNVPKH